MSSNTTDDTLSDPASFADLALWPELLRAVLYRRPRRPASSERFVAPSLVKMRPR